MVVTTESEPGTSVRDSDTRDDFANSRADAIGVESVGHRSSIVASNSIEYSSIIDHSSNHHDLLPETLVSSVGTVSLRVELTAVLTIRCLNGLV